MQPAAPAVGLPPIDTFLRRIEGFRVNWIARHLLFVSLLALAPLSATGGNKSTVNIRNQVVSFWRTADLESAKKEAAAAHKPIAWIAASETVFERQGTISGKNGRDATLHAFYALRDRTVLIFEDAYAENHKVLKLVDDALHTPDPHYTPPVVVFLDPDATEVLAKVSYEPDFTKRAHALADALDACKATANPKPEGRNPK